MKNNKNIFSLALLLFLVATVASACSLPWQEGEFISNLNLNGSDSEEIDTEKEVAKEKEKEKEIEEDIYSNRLKIYSDINNLKNFLYDNRHRSSYKEIEKRESLNYLDIKNEGDNVYQNANVLEEAGDKVFYLNKNKLKVIAEGEEETYEIKTENDFNFKANSLIVHDSLIVIYGQEEDSTNTILKVFEINQENQLNLVKDYKFIGKSVGLIEKQGQLYFIFESDHSYEEKNYLPNIEDNGVNIFASCEENNSCWDTYYFDSNYDSYRFLGVSHLDLNNLDNDLNGQFYLLNKDHKTILTNDSFYIAYDIRADRELYEYQAKKEIIFTSLNDEDQKIVTDVENSSEELFSQLEKKEKIEKVLDSYLDSLLETERILVQADITDLVDEKINENGSLNNQTILHRFTLDGRSIFYFAKVNLRGYFNSIDKIYEKDNLVYLSTHSERFDEEGEELSDYTNLYILDDALKVKGKMEKLGTKDNIFQVNFVGDRVFLLSEEEKGSIYVIDSSEMDNMNFLGSVKLNGLENYLQVLDDNGNYFASLSKYKNDDDEDEIKLSLYDFSDLKNPKELDGFLIGKNSTESFAFKSPKSFYYSNNIISFPVTFYEEGRLSFSGAFFFSYKNDSLEFEGRLDHSAGGYFNQKYESQEIERRENTVINFLEKDNKVISVSSKYLTHGNLDDIENSLYLSLSENPDDSLIPNFENEGLETSATSTDDVNNENENMGEDSENMEEDVADNTNNPDSEEFMYDQFETIPLPDDLTTSTDNEIIIEDGVLNDSSTSSEEII
ncbi:MAG: beta-propeller domain-containing protein [Patescibacteria group bacterium]|jgi:uncharacterized secreted protein with C-terminal beta-propeller domain|nr:beta-propeller domain-containing protein [Patescibacteria group bacterium]